MFDKAYRQRLANDLPSWRARGWITDEGARNILASLDADRRPGFGLAAVVAVLGTLLLGFGLFAFIGANWDYMPRIARFGLLVLALALAYGAGAVLQKKDLPRFADAAVLLGGMVFAGAIALVGQTYHLAGEFADAVLLWLVGASIAAFATRSVSGTVLALAGACYWIWLAAENGSAPHWGGLAAILLLGAHGVLLDSRIARTTSIFALAFWIVMTVIVLGRRFDLPAAGGFAMLGCIGLAVWAIGLVMTTLPPAHAPRTIKMGQDLVTPAFAGFLLAAGVLQIALFDMHGSRGDGTFWIGIAVGALVIAAALAALAWRRGALRIVDVAATAVLGAALLAVALWGDPDEFSGRLAAGSIVILACLWWISLGHAGHASGSKLGLFAFGAQVLYLYSVTLGSLIDTALAFLVGGVLFIALAFLLYRLDKRLAAREVAP